MCVWVYRNCDPDIQALLGKSRAKEWNGYVSFGVAIDYVARGAEELPTQWVERDKNEVKRIKDEAIPRT